MSDANVQSDDIGTKLERLAANFDKLSDQLAKFSGAVVQTLSGQPASAPVKRRGRPPKNAAAATPLIAQTVSAPLAKASHPLAVQALSIIERTGRITQSALAEEMKVERSAVEYHTNALLAEGKIVKRTVRPNGVKTILFYRHDWAHFKGE